MSALLFGLAIGASGCIFVTSDDDDTGTAQINATWDIVDDGAQANCPTGATTAAVNALRSGDADPFVDLYDCDDFAGAASDLPAGNYTIWVDITDDSGAELYAQSESATVSLSDGETVGADFLIDGYNGFWDISWTIHNAGGTEIGCAGAAGENGVGVLSTNTDTNEGFDSLYNCEDGEDPAIVTSDAVPVGGYVVVLSILDNADASMGDSNEIQDAILHGNEFVDLGSHPITLGHFN
jgi:hypothetical protein